MYIYIIYTLYGRYVLNTDFKNKHTVNIILYHIYICIYSTGKYIVNQFKINLNCFVNFSNAQNISKCKKSPIHNDQIGHFIQHKIKEDIRSLQ